MSATRIAPRLLTEGAVIVVSILLAFWIDAAWADRLDRLQERDAIAALHAEAISNATEIASTIENVRRSQAAALAFFESAPAELGEVTADETRSLIRDLTIPNRASLQTGALDALVASGRIGVIGDHRLQELVAAWPAAAARLDERSDLLIQLQAQMQQHLGRHADTQAWQMGGEPTRPLNLASLREDSAAMATLSTIQAQRGIHVIVLERLAVELNSLIGVLDEARR